MRHHPPAADQGQHRATIRPYVGLALIGLGAIGIITGPPAATLAAWLCVCYGGLLTAPPTRWAPTEDNP